VVFLETLPHPDWAALTVSVLAGTGLVWRELRAARPFNRPETPDARSPGPHLRPNRADHAVRLRHRLRHHPVAGGGTGHVR
jgi:hypothetical protein